MAKRLKVYVWEDVLRDYSAGMAVAVAETETEARHLLEVEAGRVLELDRAPRVIDPVKGNEFAAYVYGGG